MKNEYQNPAIKVVEADIESAIMQTTGSPEQGQEG